MKQLLIEVKTVRTAPGGVEKTFKSSNEGRHAMDWMVAVVKRLFPKASDDDLNGMRMCTTEVVRNATKEAGQFPVRVALERRENCLYCEATEAKPFENPKNYELPENPLQPNGRGAFLLRYLLGEELKFDGGRGRTRFNYYLGGHDAVAFAHQKPLGENPPSTQSANFL